MVFSQSSNRIGTFFENTLSAAVAKGLLQRVSVGGISVFSLHKSAEDVGEGFSLYGIADASV